MTEARKLVGVVLVAFVVMAVYVTLTAGHIVSNERKGCGRGKTDRFTIVTAWRAQRDYIGKVLDAKSVQEDVKVAAAIEHNTLATQVVPYLAARAKAPCHDQYTTLLHLP